MANHEISDEEFEQWCFHANQQLLDDIEQHLGADHAGERAQLVIEQMHHLRVLAWIQDYQALQQQQLHLQQIVELLRSFGRRPGRHGAALSAMPMHFADHWLRRPEGAALPDDEKHPGEPGEATT